MARKQHAWLAMSLAVCMLAASAAPAFSQEAAGDKLAKQWEDFIHYIIVGREDLAKSYGEAVVAAGDQSVKIYLLSQKTPDLAKRLKQGERFEVLKKIIADVRKILHKGYLAQASNPKEIAKSIAMLSGTLEQFQVAVGRLKESGEYALPQLLQAWSSPKTDEKIRDRIVTVLPQLGPRAVRGMSMALRIDDVGLQEILADALRDIGYAHAAPRLRELLARKGVLERAKHAAHAALIACAGKKAPSMSVSAHFYQLAENYYRRAESLLPDKRFDTANVWRLRKGRLEYTVVPRAIFCDLYAIRMARLALQYDRKAGKAVSLWLAARLRKEADLPDGATDPLADAKAPGARYYALAAGPRFLLAVLARGLRDQNSAVASGAIESLARTATAESLVQRIDQGAKPLVDALTYPGRRVRFLAAAALAEATPTKRFDGSAVVLTVLNEALRQKGKKTALVSIADLAKANAAADVLRKAGYEVLSEGNAAKALTAGHKASGVDMVVLADKPDPVKFIAAMRRDPNYMGVPAVVAHRGAALRNLTKTDRRVVMLTDDAGAAAIGKAVAQAASLSIGSPLTSEEADAWAVRAARILRILALTGNKVLPARRALVSLVEAAQSGAPAVRIAAAEALAVLKSPKAQRTLAQIACSSTDDKILLAAFAAVSEAMVLRDAAAQTLGSMNLSSEKIESLILGAK